MLALEDAQHQATDPGTTTPELLLGGAGGPEDDNESVESPTSVYSSCIAATSVVGSDDGWIYDDTAAPETLDLDEKRLIALRQLLKEEAQKWQKPRYV